VRLDLTDTTAAALRDALTKTSQRLGSPTSGVVLNLIIVAEESSQHDAMYAAGQAGREHPCRVLGVIARDPRARARLDAEIRVGEEMPGQLALLRLYGPPGEHADSVIAPLLVPDTPVVTWWPGSAPPVPSDDLVGVLAQRRITDSAASPDPRRMLDALAASYAPGDTDLAWTRATNWRSLLAATLDRPHSEITAVRVAAEPGNPTAELLTAWLGLRLRVPATLHESGGPGITGAAFECAEGDIAISRPDGRNATLSRPGEPDRYVALHRRDSADLLSEELRRLDPDEVYGEVLAATGAAALAGQADTR
jgi:glucose-6-phosphate dehydrogenase assembly protein OpcA